MLVHTGGTKTSHRQRHREHRLRGRRRGANVSVQPGVYQISVYTYPFATGGAAEGLILLLLWYNLVVTRVRLPYTNNVCQSKTSRFNNDWNVVRERTVYYFFFYNSLSLTRRYRFTLKPRILISFVLKMKDCLNLLLNCSALEI